MNNYDFMTLSPQDFESLSADLLSKDLEMRFEQFKPGKDGGVDLLNALTSTEAVIVQCKRYSPSSFSALERSMRVEKAKLDKLQPKQYLLTTTVPLSPANKTALQDAVKPYISSTSDIYGADDLNQLLRQFPEVLRAHFKLWISGTAVLERILNARIFSQTEASLAAIRKYASRLVVHAGLQKAMDLLRERHHVMIVGNPGIGKSTLARMIMCRYIEENYEPVWVTGSIDDAWSVIHSADKSTSKFIVVYDDFLGRLRFDSEKFGKNEDSSLLSLIDHAASLPNLRLVLTTREYILADAKRLHGTFAARADEITRYTLSLADYTRPERAQMLFNHLYFSDLPNSRLNKLVESKIYRVLLEQRHFNPRIVERVSSYANSRTQTDEEYLAFLKTEFENPATLWKHPFEQEISPIAREVLGILWTFNGQAEVNQLRDSVRRLHTDISGPEFHLKFDAALRQLDGNFIMTDLLPGKDRAESFHIAEFQNPSVEEFVESEVQKSHWLETLANSCINLRQIDILGAHLRDQHADGQATAAWELLRERAQASCSAPLRRVRWFQHWNETNPIKTWAADNIADATKLSILVKLEMSATTIDQWCTDLVAQLTSNLVWQDLLAICLQDSLEAYSLSKLQDVIHQWDEEVAEQSECAIRRALEHVLSSDSARAVSLAALAVVLEAANSFEEAFSAVETKLVAAAAQESVRTAIFNGWDAQSLRDEASGLTEIGMLIAIEKQVMPLVRDLEKEAEKTESLDRSDADSSEPMWRPAPDFKVDEDALFRGLLDRE